jgi:methylmalonyl-CoA mutase
MPEPDPDDLPLAAEFPAATRDQWLKLVEGVLKGAPFDKRLVGRTFDGLAIEPLYSRDATARPITARPPGAPWTIVQRVDHPDPAAANAEALHDLENGATGLTLVFAGAVGSYGFGLDSSAATLAHVLDGVYLDAGIAIDLDLAWNATDAPARIAALIKQRKLDPATIELRMSFDPIGGLAASGMSLVDWPTLAPRFATMIGDFVAQGFRGPFALADGRVVHAAGGSEAQELAFVLAAAVAYLRAFEASGVALDRARDMVHFRLAADADQFLTVAKFRALRKLWARVETACALTPKPAHVAAETAWRMMTKRDPWVNMLRATVASFAAGLGGADSVTVLPYTMPLGLPDRFARRIARNTQLVLLEESNLAKVTDPAAGSGGIEDLTAKLCTTAWSLFQEIEAAGGAWAALQRGLIQTKVAVVRAEREKAIARRKDALTGTSEFPDINELPVVVLEATPVAVPPHGPTAVSVEPLPSIRLAEPFEKLREASDLALRASGSRPQVFLANLGPLAEFTARATFAKNFFEAGGIAAVTNDGFAGRADMIAAFKASGARLVCLCSSDKVYAGEAAEAAKALKAAGAMHMYLAGRPGELEAALKASGVQGFIYVGCDVVATLREAHGKLTELARRTT